MSCFTQVNVFKIEKQSSPFDKIFKCISYLCCQLPSDIMQYYKYLNCKNICQGAEMNVTDHQGMSAVHWAVVRGHLDVVRLLVDLGAFLNNIANLPHGKIQAQ
jgi:ankyrin repeat protein